MTLMRIVLFVLVFSAIQASAHYYFWRRLVRDTGMRPPWRRWATFAIVFLGVLVPLTLWSSRLVSPRIGQLFGWPALIWMGVSVLLITGFATVDMLRLTVWFARFRRAREREGRGHEPIVDVARREFLARVAGGTVMTAAVGASGMGLYEVLRDHTIETVPVALPRLPGSMDGFVLAQLTDIHVGLTVTRAYVENMVALTNAMKPDLIAITGDLVDGDVATLGRAVAALGDLRAPHGVYFVTGNHEYYSGVEPWLAELSRIGIRVLRNERVVIGEGRDSFDLAGIDDLAGAQYGRGHGPDIARAVAGRDPERELVLLAHQPRCIGMAVRHGVGLQLSGHTHGGQIWPWHYAVKAQQSGLLAGLERRGDTQVYVSRGTGYWGPPIRVGAPAEITKLILRAGSSA